MSKVPAHHELIPEIVALRNKIAPQTLLTINGDIRDRAHVARDLVRDRHIRDVCSWLAGTNSTQFSHEAGVVFTRVQFAALLQVLQRQLDSIDYTWRWICANP